MKESYKWIKAHVLEDGIRFEYQLKGSKVVGQHMHEEDVSNYADEEIMELAKMMIDATPKEAKDMEIIY